jgi:hypothetical protein
MSENPGSSVAHCSHDNPFGSIRARWRMAKLAIALASRFDSAESAITTATLLTMEELTIASSRRTADSLDPALRGHGNVQSA